MISFNNVTLQRGSNVLVEAVSLTIFAKDRVGLIGHNGSGKSTLFAALCGEVDVARGEIYLPNGMQIARLRQEMPETNLSALEFVMQGDKRTSELRQKIQAAEAVADYEALATLYTEFSELDGFSVESRAAKILNGLGFSDDVFANTVNSFSGGWRMRLNLAQCLVQPNELLLLDEPTNHLDLETVLWLEQWLKKHAGTVIIISHDRDFLDGVINQIWYIEHKHIQNYAGNYSSFEEQRAMQIALQNARYEKQQKEKAKVEEFAARFRFKASKAKQVQSRLKLFEKQQRLEAYYQSKSFRFEFSEPERPVNKLVHFDRVAVGYGDVPLLKNIRLELLAGSRVGLLGKNGSGKSTFMKLIMDELTPSQGSITKFPKLVIGYFAQHQLQALHLTENAFWHMQELDRSASTQQIRDFLGKFGFPGDMAFSAVNKLSGGEKARLALAMIVYLRPNLLLLDEPTNHLDLDMREALMLALQHFHGALLLVSHDRYLLKSCVDELWWVNKQTVSPFEGDVDDYLQLLS